MGDKDKTEYVCINDVRIKCIDKLKKLLMVKRNLVKLGKYNQIILKNV